jgi:hypothetical protein
MVIKLIRSLVRGSILGLTLSLFLFLFIPSCQTMSKKSDKRLQPYIDTFLSLCSKYKKNCSGWKNYKYLIMPIPKTILEVLSPKEAVTIGRCNRINNTVIIDEKYFNNSPIEHIESTMIHELGHCVLKKPHVDEEKVSIMNPYSMSSWIYTKYYQVLMNDFFECKKNCPKVQFDMYRY